MEAPKDDSWGCGTIALVFCTLSCLSSCGDGSRPNAWYQVKDYTIKEFEGRISTLEAWKNYQQQKARQDHQSAGKADITTSGR